MKRALALCAAAIVCGGAGAQYPPGYHRALAKSYAADDKWRACLTQNAERYAATSGEGAEVTARAVIGICDPLARDTVKPLIPYGFAPAAMVAGLERDALDKLIGFIVELRTAH